MVRPAVPYPVPVSLLPVRKSWRAAAVFLGASTILLAAAAGQSASTPRSTSDPSRYASTSAASGFEGSTANRRSEISPAGRHNIAFSRLAISPKLSTLGYGLEIATPLTPRTNLRLGGNFFDYNSTSFSVANIDLSSQIHFRSTQLALDYEPIHWLGLQLSPGLLLYNNDRLTGIARVPGGHSFSPGNATYISSPRDPVTGSLSIGFNQIAPSFTVGFGNLLPRSGRSWSIPVQAGFAYTGSPAVSLNLRGTVCDKHGVNCRAIPTAPDVLANIALEAAKVSSNVSPLSFYPMFSIGFAYNFRLRPERRYGYEGPH